MSRVYILIVNWNGWADTIECLESVFQLDYPDYRVIVCDNGSTDGSVDQIVAWAEGSHVFSRTEGPLSQRGVTSPPVAKPVSFVVYDRQEAESGGDLGRDPRLILVRAGANLGFAGGNNIGLRYARTRGDFSHIWLLNNDTVVDSGALGALMARMAEKPSAGLCGSTLVRYERPERLQARGGGWYCRWIGLPWHIGQLEKVDDRADIEHVEKWMNYVVGASMLVSREFLADVGLMCEDYFLYFEELDWVSRARGRYSLAYAPESLVYHKVGRSIGTSTDPRKKSVTCDYYNIRNRIRFTQRYYPAALPAIYLSLCATIFNRLLLGQLSRSGMILKLMLSWGRDLKTLKPGV